MADFKVQRGWVAIPSGSTSATITAGVDYVAPADVSRAFLRMTGNNSMAQGTTGDFGGAVHHNIIQIENSGNLATSVTFSRVTSTGDNGVSWEIIEYIGAAGGPNEFIVRHREQGSVAGSQIDSGVVSGVVDDSKVLPLIAGTSAVVGNWGRGESEDFLFTTEWIAASQVARYTKGQGTRDVNISLAVIEFTGSNWSLRRIEHTFTGNTVENVSISPALADASKAILFPQHRLTPATTAGADQTGVQAMIDTTSQLAVRALGTDYAAHTVVVWILENAQSGGAVDMSVTRYSGSIAAGGVQDELVAITPVDDTAQVSVTGTSGYSNTPSEDQHHAYFGTRLTSASQVTVRRGATHKPRNYWFEITRWPDGGAGGPPPEVQATGNPTLPALQAGGAATAQVAATGAAPLPALQAGGVVAIDVEATGAASLPALRAAGTIGGVPSTSAIGAITLPALQAGAVGEVEIEALAAALLPALTAIGAGSVPVEAAGLALLPALLAGASIEAPVRASGVALLPALMALGRASEQDLGAIVTILLSLEFERTVDLEVEYERTVDLTLEFE